MADAATNAWIDYLEDVLGFDGYLSTQVAIGEDYRSIWVFLGAKEDHIEQMISQIRKTPIDDAHPEDKVRCSSLQARILYALVDYARYLHTVQREHSPVLGSLENLHQIAQYYSSVGGSIDDDPKFPDHPDKFDNVNSEIMLENIYNWVRSSLGKHKIPMRAYIRVDPLPAQDPGFLAPDIITELATRARLDGATARFNIERLWGCIYAVCHGTDAWDMVKGYEDSMDGRNAYLDLTGHYRGEGTVNTLRQQAETTLETVWYDGPHRKFDFRTFGSRLTGAFSTLSKFGDPRTETAKVLHMLSRIDPNCGLEPAMSQIRNDPYYLGNFRESLNMLTNDANIVARRSNTPRARRRVAAVETTGRGRGRSGQGRGGRGFGGGGRGRGRGRGRGSGRGRGGRNGGRGGVWSEDGTILLNNGGYPPDLWRSLTQNDRNEVLRQRANSRFQSRQVNMMDTNGRDAGGDDNGNGNEEHDDSQANEQQDFSMTRRRGRRG